MENRHFNIYLHEVFHEVDNTDSMEHRHGSEGRGKGKRKGFKHR